MKANRRPSSKSIVYVIPEDLRRGPTKVGITKRAPRKGRLQALQTGNPRRLTPYATRTVANARKIESEVHRRLASKRMQGEWFDISPHDALIVLDAVISEERRPIYREIVNLVRALVMPVAFLVFLVVMAYLSTGGM